MQTVLINHDCVRLNWSLQRLVGLDLIFVQDCSHVLCECLQVLSDVFVRWRSLTCHNLGRLVRHGIIHVTFLGVLKLNVFWNWVLVEVNGLNSLNRVRLGERWYITDFSWLQDWPILPQLLKIYETLLVDWAVQDACDLASELLMVPDARLLPDRLHLLKQPLSALIQLILCSLLIAD